VEILDDGFAAIPDGDLTADMATNGGEVVVALTPSGARHGVVGQVVLRWTGGPAAPPDHTDCTPPRTSSYWQPLPGTKSEDLEPEGQLHEALTKLTPVEKKTITQALKPPLAKRGKVTLKRATRVTWQGSAMRHRMEVEPHVPATVTRSPQGAPASEVLDRKLRAICRLRGSFGSYPKACGAPP
jgi:hypothetical protein